MGALYDYTNKDLFIMNIDANNLFIRVMSKTLFTYSYELLSKA